MFDDPSDLARCFCSALCPEDLFLFRLGFLYERRVDVPAKLLRVIHQRNGTVTDIRVGSDGSGQTCNHPKPSFRGPFLDPDVKRDIAAIHTLSNILGCGLAQFSYLYQPATGRQIRLQMNVSLGKCSHLSPPPSFRLQVACYIISMVNGKDRLGPKFFEGGANCLSTKAQTLLGPSLCESVGHHYCGRVPDAPMTRRACRNRMFGRKEFEKA